MKIKFETRNIPVSDIARNTGQISGVPANPRRIDKGRLERLRSSLESSGQLLELRPVIVYRHGKGYVVIAGNMRFAAAQMEGWEEIPCHVITEVDSEKTLREIAIKDNVSFGKDDFESLMAEWDIKELDDWGLEIHSVEKSEKGDGADAEYKPETVDIVLSVPTDEADTTVAFLASNGYECSVKPKKKKK